MGGWNQEVWSALYQVGRMQAGLGFDWRIVLNSYLQAFNFRPSRLEPIYAIARFYREHGQFALGYHFSRLITEVSYPEDILFVERDVYQHLLPIEYAACCFGIGRAEEGSRVCQELLAWGGLPTDQIATVGALLSKNCEGTAVNRVGDAPESRPSASLPSEAGPLSFVSPGWWEGE